MASLWDTPEGKLGKEGENWVLKWRRDAGIYVCLQLTIAGLMALMLQ